MFERLLGFTKPNLPAIGLLFLREFLKLPGHKGVRSTLLKSYFNLGADYGEDATSS